MHFGTYIVKPLEEWLRGLIEASLDKCVKMSRVASEHEPHTQLTSPAVVNNLVKGQINVCNLVSRSVSITSVLLFLTLGVHCPVG